MFICHAAIVQDRTNSKKEDPFLTAMDENYVLVDYQNLKRFPVTRIDLRNEDENDKMIAVAASIYDEIEYGPTAVFQPLNDDKTMIGVMDTCNEYEDLILRTDGLVPTDIQVEYHPDISKLSKEYFKWICIQNETLNQLAFNQKRSCLEKGEILFSDGKKYPLSKKLIKVDTMISSNQKVTLTGLKYKFDTDMDKMTITLTACKEDILRAATPYSNNGNRSNSMGYPLIIGVSVGVGLLVSMIVISIVVVKRKNDNRMSIDRNPDYGRSIYLNYYQSTTTRDSQDYDETGDGYQ